MPPAAGIRLHFQSLKGGLINSIIHSFTFMAQPDAARQGNVPPLTHLDRLECFCRVEKRLPGGQVHVPSPVPSPCCT